MCGNLSVKVLYIRVFMILTLCFCVELNESQECDDIAIIGAGIAGTYAAWRLRYSKLRIGLYEYSQRTGGRMYTQRFPGIPDVPIEYGAMRYFPSGHKLMHMLVDELNLGSIYTSRLTDSSQYHLRGKVLRQAEVAKYLNTNIFPFPYNVNKAYLKPNYTGHLAKDILRNLFLTKTNYSSTAPAHTVATDDGILLTGLSVAEVMMKYLNNDSIEFIKDYFGFEGIFSMASSMVLPNSAFYDFLGTQHGVAAGFQSIPLSLLRGFLKATKRNKFHPNYRLDDIQRTSEERLTYRLGFTKTLTKNGQTAATNTSLDVCAKKIILAIPKPALKVIKWPWNGHQETELKYKMDFVVELKSCKVFLVYKNAWWKNKNLNLSHVITDTSLQQLLHYGESSSTGKGILLVYYTNKDLKVWEKLNSDTNYFGSSHGDTALTRNTVNVIQKYLSELLNIDINDLPIPIDGRMKMWNEFPIGGCAYFAAPHYKEIDVQEILRKPSQTDDIFIITNSFSLKHLGVWGEGSLLEVERLLQNNFDLGPIGDIKYAI